MDSITQATLGAAVLYPVLGPQLGRKAMYWGLALGTLPDLDVLVPMGDAVANFVFHRGASHSLLMHLWVAPLLAKLLQRVHRNQDLSFWRTCLATFLVLSTHALLDAFTVYGTQIFWPLPLPPASWSTLFIIDPLFTLPLLGGLGWALRKPAQRGARVVSVTLGLSMVYLSWSLVAKLWVESVLPEVWEKQAPGHRVTQVLTTPAPFNTLLWRAVAMVPGGYLETYYSLIASPNAEPRVTFYPSEPELLEQVGNQTAVNRLTWFTQGFFKVRETAEGRVLFSDLRMGSEPSYVFTFDLGSTSGEDEEPQRVAPRVSSRDLRQLPDRFRNH